METPEQNSNQPKTKSKMPYLAGGLLIPVLIAGYLFVGKKPVMAPANEVVEPTPATAPAPTPVTLVPPPPVVVPKNGKYEDGEYSVVGNYNSPGGPESINVSLTLKDDVITAATVISNAKRPTSVMMQGKFIGGFKQLVVGKKIDEVQLSKVSGSSLTPKGWNDAITKIKLEARS